MCRYVPCFIAAYDFTNQVDDFKYIWNDSVASLLVEPWNFFSDVTVSGTPETASSYQEVNSEVSV